MGTAEAFKRIVPETFRKIAQVDSSTGVKLAAVYFNREDNAFFIEATRPMADGQHMPITFGPIPSDTFNSLASIMADVQDMNKKYFFLE